MNLRYKFYIFILLIGLSIGWKLYKLAGEYYSESSLGKKLFFSWGLIEDDDNYSIRFDKYYGLDTLMIRRRCDDGSILSRGRNVIGGNEQPSGLKIGKWTEYYRNGQKKSEGKYIIGSYINCPINGPSQGYYDYKIGEWK